MLWKRQDCFMTVDWAVLAAHGLPCRGTKFPADAEGTFKVGGWTLKLYSQFGARAMHGPGVRKRLFVICVCGTEVEAGHFGMHWFGEKHMKTIMRGHCGEGYHHIPAGGHRCQCGINRDVLEDS